MNRMRSGLNTSLLSSGFSISRRVKAMRFSACRVTSLTGTRKIPSETGSTPGVPV
jgi:hypothetical protein